MNVLELFCGTKSFSKVAESMGHKVFTVDNNPAFNPDLCIDILDLKPEMIPFKPDIIWASPPCTEYSVCNSHGNRKIEYANKLVLKSLFFIDFFKPKYWIIENPKGLIQSQEFMKNLNKTMITYCQYGTNYMKPTYIYNNFNFIGKKCKNGDKCHISAPRGSKTGVQGLKNAKIRGIIPIKLCEEILKCCV